MSKNLPNQEILDFIKVLYKESYRDKNQILLHEPNFSDKEKFLVNDCMNTTMVSNVGEYVNRFESMVAKAMDRKFAVATSSGTCGLHLALKLAGVVPNDLVITQALTFVATANAISHCGADPVFLDVDPDVMGLSPVSLKKFIVESCTSQGKLLVHKQSGRVIRACVPVHILGHPLRIQEVVRVCEEFGIPVVEDAAEALGSTLEGRAAGSFGLLAMMSFNGNKIVTTGGGGAIVTDDSELAALAKSLSATAKVGLPWEYNHDRIAYNYRLPNLNAALGVGQMERLESFLENKRRTAKAYRDFFNESGVEFVDEPKGCKSNFWLNSIKLKDRKARDEFLALAIEERIMARPFWYLMNDLPMYKEKICGDLSVSRDLYARVVSLPSSVRF